MKNSRTTVLVLFTFLLILGCSHKPKKNTPSTNSATPNIAEVKNINSQEKKEKLVALPSEWNSYRQSLDELVGTYIALVPDTSSPTGYSVEILDRALTEEGIQKIEQKLMEGAQPIYKSRVEGTFAANLSFVVGKITTTNESLYDFTLADNAIALIPPDSKYTDQKKADLILSKLPEKYKDLFFVTSVTHRILVYKEFQKYTGAAEAAYTVVKAGANYYYGNEFSSVTHTIYFSGLSDASLFGSRNASGGLFTKRKAVSNVAEAKLGTAISEESIDLLRSAINLNQVQLVR